MSRVCPRHSPVLVGLFGLGCGSDSLPTAPTPMTVEFSLAGSVHDTAFRAVPDVRIDVIDGPRTGAFALTDPVGNYELPGVFADVVTVRTSKADYVSVEKTYRTSNRGRQYLDFAIEPTVPSADIAGEYTLTLAADSICTALPDTIRARTYSAAIRPLPQSGSPHAYETTLTGAAFLASALNNRFVMGVAGSVARFVTDSDGTGIAEAVTESIYVAFTGQADLSVDGARISGLFAGTFEYCPSYVSASPFYRCDVTSVACLSANHRVTLLRR